MRSSVGFTADPRAVAKLAYDADLSGLIVLPTITMHALRDPTIPFTAEADYARVVQAAGRSHLLVQSATDEQAHSSSPRRNIWRCSRR